MTTKEIIKTLGFLEFTMELDRSSTAGWIRFRHKLAPDTPDFALIIYTAHAAAEIFGEVERMLRKMGQYQKIQQLTEFVD